MITVEPMEPMSIDPTQYSINEHGSINPFHQDLVRMGVSMGTNCTIMMSNFDSQECLGFVVVNTRTGERVWVTLDGVDKKGDQNG